MTAPQQQGQPREQPVAASPLPSSRSSCSSRSASRRHQLLAAPRRLARTTAGVPLRLQDQPRPLVLGTQHRRPPRTCPQGRPSRHARSSLSSSRSSRGGRSSRDGSPLHLPARPKLSLVLGSRHRQPAGAQRPCPPPAAPSQATPRPLSSPPTNPPKPPPLQLPPTRRRCQFLQQHLPLLPPPQLAHRRLLAACRLR